MAPGFNGKISAGTTTSLRRGSGVPHPLLGSSSSDGLSMANGNGGSSSDSPSASSSSRSSASLPLLCFSNANTKLDDDQQQHSCSGSNSHSTACRRFLTSKICPLDRTRQMEEEEEAFRHPATRSSASQSNQNAENGDGATTTTRRRASLGPRRSSLVSLETAVSSAAVSTVAASSSPAGAAAVSNSGSSSSEDNSSSSDDPSSLEQQQRANGRQQEETTNTYPRRRNSANSLVSLLRHHVSAVASRKRPREEQQQQDTSHQDETAGTAPPTRIARQRVAKKQVRFSEGGPSSMSTSSREEEAVSVEWIETRIVLVKEGQQGASQPVAAAADSPHQEQASWRVDPQELWWSADEMKRIRNECCQIVKIYQKRPECRQYLSALKLLYKEQKCPQRFERLIQITRQAMMQVIMKTNGNQGEDESSTAETSAVAATTTANTTPSTTTATVPRRPMPGPRGLEGHMIRDIVKRTTWQHKQATLQAAKPTEQQQQGDPNAKAALIRNESKLASLASTAFASAQGILDMQEALTCWEEDEPNKGDENDATAPNPLSEESNKSSKDHVVMSSD